MHHRSAIASTRQECKCALLYGGNQAIKKLASRGREIQETTETALLRKPRKGARRKGTSFLAKLRDPSVGVFAEQVAAFAV